MSPLADGYIINNQRIKIIVENKSLWLRKHPLQQLGSTQMGGFHFGQWQYLDLGSGSDYFDNHYFSESSDYYCPFNIGSAFTGYSGTYFTHGVDC